MLSDLFYTINYSLAIIIAIIGLILGFLVIMIFSFNRQCQTILNLLICNAAVTIILYSILNISACIYALRDDWFFHQPACAFRAYIFGTLCVAICYSYAIQAISRLFFAVLYKHKQLLTWPVHWLLIVFNWLIASIIAIIPILINDGYIFEEESRLCIITMKTFPSAIYIIFIGWFIPLSITFIAYSIILYKAHQSSRRLVTFAVSTKTINRCRKVSPAPNINRELKIMKNMLIPIGILALGGMPVLIATLWHLTSSKLPESLYLLAINCISMSACFTTMTSFIISKELRQYVVVYLRKLY